VDPSHNRLTSGFDRSCIRKLGFAHGRSYRLRRNRYGYSRECRGGGGFPGVRKTLAQSGVAFGGFYAAETFGNPSGGIRQGATYDGVLELNVNADMHRFGLWKGLCFCANGYQIHGQSITVDAAW
jgi:carbohydrate-selective porin OprB